MAVTMTSTPTQSPPQDTPEHDLQPEGPLVGIAVRGGIGGTLMGLANLVPGISGGTMLLASGVYQPFVNAIAELSTLKFRLRSLVLLGSVGFMAFLAIVLLAGPVKDLVVNQRWVAYSIFIGLTLGGVPLIWALLREARAERGATNLMAVIGTLSGLCAMLILAEVKTSGGGSTNFGLLLLAGLAGASAMILPGLSGGYMLLVLGQYVPILASIDRCKDAVGARDFQALLAEWVVVVPVGFGVVVGVVGGSNLVKFMLTRFEGLTLGVLMGLLLGSVRGLWPFQHGVAPEIGSLIKGSLVNEESLDAIAQEDWPLKLFSPSAGQVVWSVVLIAVGLAVTLGIARLGERLKRD